MDLFIVFMSPWAGALELHLCSWSAGGIQGFVQSQPLAPDPRQSMQHVFWLVVAYGLFWENWFQHVWTTTSPNHRSQGFSTAFGKPASKLWTSQYTASCLDVLAMLASMVGFLAAHLIHLRPLGWIGSSNHQQFKETAKGLVARLSSNVGVSASTTRPRTQYSIL